MLEKLKKMFSGNKGTKTRAEALRDAVNDFLMEEDCQRAYVVIQEDDEIEVSVIAESEKRAKELLGEVIVTVFKVEKQMEGRK